MDERQVHCTVLFEKKDFLVLTLHETYEHRFVPPEVFVNEVQKDMDYELNGEILVMTYGRIWNLALEVGENITELLERLDISPDEKTIKIAFEENKTVVRISFPIRGSAPFICSGLRWQFHKSDADPWPSILHGHCKEKPWVMDGFTGDIYDSRTRKLVGNIGKRGLRKLRQCLSQSKDFQQYFSEDANTPRPA